MFGVKKKCGPKKGWFAAVRLELARLSDLEIEAVALRRKASLLPLALTENERLRAQVAELQLRLAQQQSPPDAVKTPQSLASEASSTADEGVPPIDFGDVTMAELMILGAPVDHA